jgi:hypothetical protein
MPANPKIILWLAALPFLLLSEKVFAQEQGVFTIVGRAGVSTSFVSDYQSLSINPANLGVRKSFRDAYVSIGFLESNVTAASEALNRGELFDAVFNANKTNFSYEQKVAAANKIADKTHALEAGITLLAASVSLPKFGGFGFAVKDQINFRGRFNRDVSNIVMLGANAPIFPFLELSDGTVIERSPGDPELPSSVREQVVAGYFADTTKAPTYAQLLGDSRVAMAWTREFQFGYGNQIIDSYNFSLYAGASVRIINGIALIDLDANGNGLNRGNISMSPSFGLEFGDSDDEASATNPTFRGFRDANAFQKVLAAEPVGNGVGFDFGLTLRIKKRFYLAGALTNVGKMNWGGNVYKLNNGLLAGIEGYGYNNYNFFRTTASGLQFAGSRSPLNWEGSRAISTQLPTTLRVGASYDYFGKFLFGVEVIAPVTDAAGGLEKVFVGVGGDYLIGRLIKISFGATRGGNQGDKIYAPLGVSYTGLRNSYEMGIATRDVLTYLSGKDGSIISFSTGFLRFKF